jgi:hypothetical protein
MAINLSTLVNQTNPLQLCKVWVNFNGITSVIQSSYNVSSITKVSTGNYTVNFAVAMTDAKYSVCTSCLAYYSTLATRAGVANGTILSTSSVTINAGGDYNSSQDSTGVYVQIFGN